MAGRNLKLTPERTEKICEHLRKGGTISAACARACIGVTTYERWYNDGGEPKARKEFRDFREAVDKAMADFEAKVLDAIDRKVDDDPKLGLEVLARRRPKDWAPRIRTEVTGEEGKPISVDFTANVRVRLAADLDALGKRLTGQAGDGEQEIAS